MRLLLTWQTLIVDCHVINSARVRTTANVAALVDELAAGLVVAQALQHQPVAGTAGLYRFIAVIHGVRRAALDTVVTARLQELTVVSAGDEYGSVAAARQTHRVLVAAVGAVDV